MSVSGFIWLASLYLWETELALFVLKRNVRGKAESFSDKNVISIQRYCFGIMLLSSRI